MKNISPFNVFGFHDVVFCSSHFPWSKGEVLFTALECMWHHCGQRGKHQLQKRSENFFKETNKAFWWYVISLSLVICVCVLCLLKKTNVYVNLCKIILKRLSQEYNKLKAVLEQFVQTWFYTLNYYYYSCLSFCTKKKDLALLFCAEICQQVTYNWKIS